MGGSLLTKYESMMHAVLSASRGCPGRYTALTTRWLATKNNTGAQKQESRSEPLINQAIVSAGFAKLRLIGIDGQQSVLVPAEAIKLAKLAKLDLILVAPEASPPVCKLVDYKKLQIERKQQVKSQAKKARGNRTVVKEIRISEAIGKHDADLKIKQIRAFLKKNYHVIVSINNPKSYRAHSHHIAVLNTAHSGGPRQSKQSTLFKSLWTTVQSPSPHQESRGTSS